MWPFPELGGTGAGVPCARDGCTAREEAQDVLRVVSMSAAQQGQGQGISRNLMSRSQKSRKERFGGDAYQE